ncbi:Hypothetical predicted protein [Marmota monax]|uniref:Uncharacterized protein n=1 Tax=Marmota monax TaxID=9995 RepID=A0A5E4AHG2_MARMO|nr:hypothetical protein GHT09_006087 [Marmota monax]VTJ56420.1 Hypothetical predicted protein [Marmota monax]
MILHFTFIFSTHFRPKWHLLCFCDFMTVFPPLGLRSLVVTNEYLLQQLNKEQKGYSGKALLPSEKSHHLGTSSPFGKSTLSSSSPVAHDTGQYLTQSISETVPDPNLWS